MTKESWAGTEGGSTVPRKSSLPSMALPVRAVQAVKGGQMPLVNLANSYAKPGNVCIYGQSLT